MYSAFKIPIAILIIDDNKGDQLILKEEIKGADLPVSEITVAGTLSEAKRLIKQAPFSLIFLDLFLPDSLGLDSFKELQKINPSIPIIIFSGFGDKKMALKAISLGAQDFLIKGDHTIEMLEKSITYSIERKKNLEIIKANNERHETLLKVTNDILWDWDMVVNKVSWSGNAIYKYLPVNTDVEKVAVRFWLKRLHKEDRRQVLADMNEAVAKRQSFWQSEYRFLRNNGQYDYIYSRGYILCNEEKLPVRMIGSLQDITEKKVADKKLASTEKRFKSLTQNSSDLIALLDKDGNYLYVSDSVIHVLGYEPPFFIGKNAFCFIHPDDLNKIQSVFAQLSNNNFIEVPPFRFADIKNQWHWLQSTLINMLDDIALGGIIVNSRDITTRIEAEQQLKEATLKRQTELTEAMIEGQEKERSEIGRELHDNINQLLVATKLYIEMGMQNKSSSKELLKSAVTYIIDAIEEIRKLSKALITPHIKDIGFIESVMGLAQDIMQVNPVKIYLEVKGFKQQELNEKFKLNIFRIFQEQVNNILKHAHAKRVNVLFEQTTEHILISISDDGIGFDTGKRKSGVGISNIVSRTALYKGILTITSSPGNGCKMNILFNEINLIANAHEQVHGLI